VTCVKLFHETFSLEASTCAEQYRLPRGDLERSRKSYDKLNESEQPKNVQAIAEARAHGDLSENAEYPCRKEATQSFIAGRIDGA